MPASTRHRAPASDAGRGACACALVPVTAPRARLRSRLCPASLCVVSWYMVSSCVAGLLLAGCDGPHEAKAAVLSSVPDPVSATTVALQVGDSISYAWTGTPSSPTSSDTSTDIVAQVNADGSSSEVRTRSDATPLEQRSLTATGQETAYQSGATSCTNAPVATQPSAPLVLGQTWAFVWTRSCVAGATASQTVHTVQGSVSAIENHTTALGALKSYKLSYTENLVGAAGKSDSQVTCWMGVETQRMLECDVATTATPAGAGAPATSTTTVQSIVGLSVAGYAGSHPSLARYAGTYAFAWTGGASCASATVGPTGQLGAACLSSGAVPVGLTLSGSVDIDGHVQATLGNASLAGKFDTPLGASGSASAPSGNGAWTLTHR